jgi:hydrogenase maturation protease
MKGPPLAFTCGNPQPDDDGVAEHVANAFLARFCDANTKLRCVQKWLPEMAEAISELRLVIFVDASAELEAGEVRSHPMQPCAVSPQSFTHSMNPAALLAVARQVDGQPPGSAYILSIGGASFELSEQLSEAARHAIPVALAHPMELLSTQSIPNPETRSNFME